MAAFWLSAAGAGWVLGGYPLALLALPRRPWKQGAELPSVSFLVPTYREHELLPVKLRSLAELDYPADRLQVIVVSDGNPELADLARRCMPEATVLLNDERRGKPTALNRALSHADGDVIVLSDAHAKLEPGALRAAVRHFADPSVWGVTGRWSQLQGAYYRYEDVLRRLETRSGSTAGVFGGFIAVRRTRMRQFPDDVVNDDLWILCRLVGDGGRVVYEPDTRWTELPLPTHQEVERRARIGAGRAMLVGELPGLPWSFRWRLVSHKFGRLLLPFLLLVTFLSSLRLSGRRGYREAALAQTLVYGLGTASAAGAPMPEALRRPAGVAGQFVAGNWGVAVGLIRAIRGRQSVRWNPVR